MSTFLMSQIGEAKTAISALFAEGPPVLVEVRFPRAGSSPDWHLCEDEEELAHILERVAPGVELHISSVWDLKNPSGAVVFRPVARREQCGAECLEPI